MIRRATLLIVTISIALGAGVPNAAAASDDAIHKDAVDCVLDGKYTLQELRHADQTVGADQREYQCWDEPYAAYLRQLGTPPDAPIIPPVVKPKDKNHDGKIDSTERAAAARQNAVVLAKYEKKYGKRVKKSKAVAAVAPSDGGGDGGDTSDTDPTSSKSSSTSDDGGTPWWLALLLIPMAIIAFGAFRLQRTNRKRVPAGSTAEAQVMAAPAARRAPRTRRATTGDEPEGPRSSFSADDDRP